MKLCSKHGLLSLDQCYKLKDSFRKDGFRYACRKCCAQYSRKQDQKKDVKRAQQKKEGKQRALKLLMNSYVKEALKHQGFTSEQITQELIDTKRAMLLLVRAIREKRDDKKASKSTS